MNKANLILRAIACGSVLLTGGSAAYHLSQAEPEVVIEAQQEDPNKTVTDNGHGTTTVTINPGDSYYVEPEKKEEESKPTVSTTTKPTTQTTTASKPTESKPSTPAPTPQATQPQGYTNWQDFVKAYSGKCPKDVPDYEHYKASMHPAISLGFGTSLTNYKNLYQAAQYVYNLVDNGYGRNEVEVYVDNMVNEPDTADLTAFALVVNSKTWQVTWRHGYGARYVVPDGKKNRIDALASRLQNQLFAFKQQYHAKCG